MVVIDTETTGLSVHEHELIEIACVEIVDNKVTGSNFRTFLQPSCNVSEAAFRVHGISTEFLRDKPKFSNIKQNFLDFIANSRLVIHNAAFDLGFLNKALSRSGECPIETSRVIDTLLLARRKFPGSPVNLDALCERFMIDRSKRDKHGALIDAELLAVVYLNLVQATQSVIGFDNGIASLRSAPKLRNRRPAQDNKAEHAEHKEFIKKMQNAIWDKYITET